MATSSVKQRTRKSSCAAESLGKLTDPRRDQDTEAPVCQQKSTGSPGQGQDGTFSQHLPDQAPTACTESGPDGDLPLPDTCPGQEQIGDIGAGDEQDKSYGSHNDPEGRSEISHHLLQDGDSE